MIDKKFKEAVSQRNLSSLRDMLRNRLLMDHDVTGGMFKECWDECVREGVAVSLYQEHDGRPLSGENSESNFNTLVGQLATNFSRERLEKVLSIAKSLWADEQSSSSKESKVYEKRQPIESAADSTAASGERILKETVICERELGTDEGDHSGFARERQAGRDGPRDHGPERGMAHRRGGAREGPEKARPRADRRMPRKRAPGGDDRLGRPDPRHDVARRGLLRRTRVRPRDADGGALHERGDGTPEAAPHRSR